MKNSDKKTIFTKVSIFHYFKLIYHSIIFLMGAWFYVAARIHNPSDYMAEFAGHVWFFILCWMSLFLEMILRLFPSSIESPGCQKQFELNYVKTGKTDITVSDNNAAMLIALIWVSFNLVFGALKVLGILDDGIMILLSLIYSICDMICILFFCPFQTWFLKNKCCASCRIYNWDYAMICTPLFFVDGVFTWALIALSIIILFRWEITLFNHPEYFSDKTNASITCELCTEKLCKHKKQLMSLWIDIAAFTKARVEKLKLKK